VPSPPYPGEDWTVSKWFTNNTSTLLLIVAYMTESAPLDSKVTNAMSKHHPWPSDRPELGAKFAELPVLSLSYRTYLYRRVRTRISGRGASSNPCAIYIQTARCALLQRRVASECEALRDFTRTGLCDSVLSRPLSLG
jgi:hypothetical protein